MRCNILIGGKAGQGIDALSQLLSSLLVKRGLYLFNYRDYQSVIRGGHNFNILCASDKPTASYDEELDMLIALDENTYSLHKGQLKKKSIVLTSEEKVEGTRLDVSELGKAENVAFAAAIAKILGFAKEDIVGIVKARFKEKNIEENKKAIDMFYDKEYDVKFELPKSDNKAEMISGSEAVANGAITAGVQRYFGYPMTPATGVLTQMALKQDHKELFVFTYENEIACINAAIGASFAGKRTMTGTAGGGFDLMSEALSFTGMSEIPLTIILGQRPGPGTGMPTYTCQSDMNVAVYSGHGDFARIVIAPGDAAEAYEKVQEAVYLAEKYNAAAILLTDKHMLESGHTNELKKSKLKIPERTEYPGKTIFKRSSYEHDDNWATIEDAETARKMADRRMKKREMINKEIGKLERYKIYGEGSTLLIGYGSTKGAVIDAGLKGIKYLHLLYLEPFPTEIINEVKKAKKVIVIEQNATGQLSELMQRHLMIKFDNRILKYDGRPFTPETIRKEVQNV